MTTDEQIDHIVKLMIEGEWKGAQSHRELAAGWGCHPRTVGDRAVTASAIVKRAGGPLEDWVLLKLAELEHVKETAMRLQKAVVVAGEVQLFDAPDTKAAAMAIKLQLEARGVFVRKVQVNANIAPGEDVKAVRAKLVAALEDVDRQIAAVEPKEVH